MRADHELSMAILNACGVPSEKVRSVVYRASVDEPATLEVEYVVIRANQIVLNKTVRFVQADDAS